MADQQQGAVASDATNQNSAGAQGNNGGATTSNSSVEITPTIRALMDSAAAAARKEVEDKQKRDQEAAETRRKQDEATARGEFDTVRDQLTRERDQASSARDSAVAERDAYGQALKDIIERRLKPLSADDRAWVRSIVPEDLPLHKQITAIESAVERIAPKETAGRGNGGDPRQAGSVDPVTEHFNRRYGSNNK